MPGFFYFLPGLRRDQTNDAAKTRRKLFEDRGLGQQISDVEQVDRDCLISDVAKGPNNAHGVIFHAFNEQRQQPEMFGYYPERQRWICIEEDRLYIGWEKETPPTPEDLTRFETLPNTSIGDSSGREWFMPIARSPHAEYGGLPTIYRFEGDKILERINKKHQWLWDLSGEVWDYFTARIAGEDAKDEHFLVKNAMKIIAVNYRVGPYEINALDDAGFPLLDQMRVEAICQALIHFEFLGVIQGDDEKKTGEPAPK